MVIFLRFLVWFLGGMLRPFRRRWQAGLPIRCLVVGYGGANNTGAEARTAQAIYQILSVDQRIEVTLTSLNRRQTLRYIEESKRLTISQINSVFIFSVVKLVLRSDILVLVEGSCFKENFASALLWFFLYSAGLAQRFGIPTVAYGVDAGTLSKRNRRWARDIANRLDSLMVRTGAAAQILRSIGVSREIVVTTDTAFLLEPESKSWAETVLTGQGLNLKRPIIGIAFEEFFWWPVVPSLWRAMRGVRKDHYKSIYYHTWGRNGGEKSREMKEQIARYADWVASEFGAQPIFFAMEGLDTAVCKDVQAMTNSPSILIDADHANARQILALIGQLDWLVTCRYHALVFAIMGLVPAIGIAHDERIASIMDEVGLIDNYFISYEERDIFNLLKEKTSKLYRESTSIRRRLEESLPVYRSRAAQNGDLFAKIVKERFGPET